MYRALFLSSFVAVSAFAVSVEDCPENIKVTVSGIEITSTVKNVLKEYGVEGTPEQEKAIRKAFANASDTESVKRDFDLEPKPKNGRCVYSDKEDRDSLEKIEIYTTNDQDKLYMQTEIGPRGILLRSYADIKAIAADDVALEDKVGVALAIPRYPYESYTAGGPLIFVGKASKAKATSRE